MDHDQLHSEVERVIRWSEVKAVVRALRSGNRPRVGQVIEYVIELPPYTVQQLSAVRPKRPYRVAVEQWHLEAAERMLREAKAQSASPER